MPLRGKVVRGGGGTVGFVGSHDELSLVEKIKSEGCGDNPTALNIAAREKILGVALASGAGYYVLAGDEFLVQRQSYMVFDNYEGESFSGCTDHDLRSFIWSINELLSMLPSRSQKSWLEFLVPNKVVHCPAGKVGAISVTTHFPESFDTDFAIVVVHSHVWGHEEDSVSMVCVKLNPTAHFPEQGLLMRNLNEMLGQRVDATCYNKAIILVCDLGVRKYNLEGVLENGEPRRSPYIIDDVEPAEVHEDNVAMATGPALI